MKETLLNDSGRLIAQFIYLLCPETEGIVEVKSTFP